MLGLIYIFEFISVEIILFIIVLLEKDIFSAEIKYIGMTNNKYHFKRLSKTQYPCTITVGLYSDKTNINNLNNDLIKYKKLDNNSSFISTIGLDCFDKPHCHGVCGLLSKNMLYLLYKRFRGEYNERTM